MQKSKVHAAQHSVDIVVGEATKSDIPIVRALLTTEYHKQGYVTDAQVAHHADALFPFLGKPQTTTFIARYQGEVYGSMSLVCDSPAGLPMDVVFQAELNKLRTDGLRLAEDCYMVVAEEMRKELRSQHRDMETLVKLFRLLVQQAVHQKVNILCGETNPKHNLIYDSLGYDTIGNERKNPEVNGAPAIAKALDLRNLQELARQHSALNMVLG